MVKAMNYLYYTTSSFALSDLLASPSTEIQDQSERLMDGFCFLTLPATLDYSLFPTKKVTQNL